MLCENANFSSLYVSLFPYRGKRLGAGKEAPHQQLGGAVDIVVDVYKLLVLAGRMHDCLVRDANL